MDCAISGRNPERNGVVGVDGSLDVVSEDNEFPRSDGTNLSSPEGDKILGIRAGGVVERCILPEELPCQTLAIDRLRVKTSRFAHQPL